MTKEDEREIAILLGKLVEKTDHMSASIDDIKTRVASSYVTIDRFKPIERAVYAIIATTSLTVLYGIVHLIVITKRSIIEKT